MLDPAGYSTIAQEALVQACFFLPERRRIRLWLRGLEEWHKLVSADAVCVSYGNSGRTWLRVLMSRYFQISYGLKRFVVIDYDNLHIVDDVIPKILFTHDNYLADYTGNIDSKIDYMEKKIIFLARDPADITVSQYFQWRYRMRERKKLINAYPRRRALDLFGFVSRPRLRFAEDRCVHERLGESIARTPRRVGNPLRGFAGAHGADTYASAG